MHHNACIFGLKIKAFLANSETVKRAKYSYSYSSFKLAIDLLHLNIPLISSSKFGKDTLPNCTWKEQHTQTFEFVCLFAIVCKFIF